MKVALYTLLALSLLAFSVQAQDEATAEETAAAQAAAEQEEFVQSKSNLNAYKLFDQHTSPDA